MPIGPGGLDAQGVWQFGENDTETLASDLLNLGQASNSTQFGIDRARMTVIENDIAALEAVSVQRAAITLPSSASASNKTLAVTFAIPFASPPTVIVGGWIASSGTLYLGVAEAVTATGFTLRVVNGPGTAWSGEVGPFVYVASGPGA